MGDSSASAVDAGTRALLDAGHRIVLQGAAAAASSPNLVRIGPVDHRALFPRAGLVVHHGGAGTTHAVCAAGVPSVVVPHVGDQRYWADRLRRLGVAPRPLPVRELAGPTLAGSAADALGDQGMRRRAEGLARQMADEDGVASATAAIEALAGRAVSPSAASS